MARMSKEMPLKVFAKKIGIDKKEQDWIEKNDKDTHYVNNSALKNSWISLSYPIYDGDYYFAFVHDKARVNAQYNAKANRELKSYIKSFLDADEIFEKMEKYFAMQFKDAGSGDTMTREELWNAIVDMRKKNPAPKRPTKESFDVMDTYRNMMSEKPINEIFGISQDPRYRAKVMKMLDDEGIKYKKDGRNALIILGVAPKDQKKLLNRIHKEFGMSSYSMIDETIEEKVSYVEYKFKNRKDAEKAMNMLKSTNLMSFDINDDNLNGGELAVDAGNKDMTKYHKQVMQKFKPKIQMSENYRKLAQKGMGTETKKDARVGLELDYYDSKGNKHMGKITKKTATGYTVQDDKTRKTHTFKFHDRVDAKKLLAASNEFDKNPLKGFPYN
jgi:hypothetical protein